MTLHLNQETQRAFRLNTYDYINNGPEIASAETPLGFALGRSTTIVDLASSLLADSLKLDPKVIHVALTRSTSELNTSLSAFYGREGNPEGDEAVEAKMLDGIFNLPSPLNRQTLETLVSSLDIPLPEKISPLDLIKKLPFSSLINLVRKIHPASERQASNTAEDEIMNIITAQMKKDDYDEDRIDKLTRKVLPHLALKDLTEGESVVEQVGEIAARTANTHWQIVKLHHYNLETKIADRNRMAGKSAKYPQRLEKSQFNAFNDMVTLAYEEYIAKGASPSEAEILAAFKIYLDIAEFED